MAKDATAQNGGTKEKNKENREKNEKTHEEKMKRKQPLHAC